MVELWSVIGIVCAVADHSLARQQHSSQPFLYGEKLNRISVYQWHPYPLSFPLFFEFTLFSIGDGA